MVDEFKGYMQQIARNLAKEVEHLAAYLEGKSESYILSNPEEVANELIMAGMSAAHMIGAYNVMDGVRETGIVPRITFSDDGSIEALMKARFYDYVEKFHLNDFDPKFYHDDHLLSVNLDTQRELSFLHNLIDHMVQYGAMDVEIEGVVKYAMVVIDAKKDKLDWLRAADDFHIGKMAKKYTPTGNAFSAEIVKNRETR